MFPLIEPLAVLLSLTGAYLVASPIEDRRQIAFCIWMLANALWVAIGISTRSPYIALLFAVYFVFSAKGYLNIGKGEKVAL
jgi:hypothetical protein